MPITLGREPADSRAILGIGRETVRQVGDVITLRFKQDIHCAGEIVREIVVDKSLQAASRFVPMERLALSPQCGFASTEEGNLLTVEEEVAKLRLVSETAKEMWGA